jgi:phage I-like protein
MKSSKKKIQFANANPEPHHAVVFFANDIAIGDDGWAMITRFGDYKSEALIPDAQGKIKREKAIQRVDKAGAQAMVASFQNARRGIRKFFKGTNIYDGHPDVPGLEKFYPDTEPKGVFADLQVRDDGLYGLPIFTNEGSDLVENKKRRAFSGNIGNSEECGKNSEGLPIYRPTELFSAGLTNHPHLPVHFFNSDDTLRQPPHETTTNQNMKKKLIAVCKLLGIQFANADIDDEAKTEAALTEVETKVAAFANEKQTLETKITGLETDKTTLTQERDSTRANLQQVQTQFANERKARIDDELGLALSGGRITAADKPAWEGRLKVEANFANEVTAIRALKPVIKTESVTVKRGGRDEQIDTNDKTAVRQFINEAIDEVCTEKKWDRAKNYDQAFQEVQRRHGALFANMQQPELATKGKKK